MDWNITDITWGRSNATLWEDAASNTTMASLSGELNNRDNSTGVQPVFTLDWNVNLTNISSNGFLIVLLSIAVLLAVLFVLFGLFMKAGAHTFDHAHSAPHSGGIQQALNTGGTSYSNLLKDEFSLFVDDDVHYME